ncbi:Uncharacterized protein Rs2_15724 [Raphanus sativus]|nr:Uncharacterized protein Rs2_15724 [Raphanus sativus]
MSSNGKSMLSSDSKSEKPKGVEADSFPGPIKPIGTPYVSSGLTIGDPHAKKARVESSVSSSSLTKLSGNTVTLPVFLLASLPESRSAYLIRRGLMTAKTSVSSGVRGKAVVSSGDKGKAIVSANVGKMMSFKDVKFGPHEGELRFRLIHFWEARNVQTKLLIGLEMLLIDQEV